MSRNRARVLFAVMCLLAVVLIYRDGQKWVAVAVATHSPVPQQNEGRRCCLPTAERTCSLHHDERTVRSSSAIIHRKLAVVGAYTATRFERP